MSSTKTHPEIDGEPAMKLTFGYSTILAALMTASISFAQPTAAKPWALVAEESTLTFTATGQGREWKGRFQEFSADIDFDPAAPDAAAIEINIPLASATMGSADVDGELKGETWFHADAFPTATFTKTKLTSAGGNDYTLEAELTLRGETVPVTFPVTISIDGKSAQASGEVILNRTSYGVGQGQFESDSTIDFEVTVRFEISATHGG